MRKAFCNLHAPLCGRFCKQALVFFFSNKIVKKYNSKFF
ncbi:MULTISPECIES: DUF6783 domain-containing protein [Clostridia]